jgi:hypothetical protein
MRTTLGPPRLSVLELAAGRNPLTVYRIVGTGRIDDPNFLDSLRSHYELSEEPRKIERTSTIIHMGISVFLERSMAEGMALRWPKLGNHTAHLDLTSGSGFNYARTSQSGHLTLWGDPVKLRDAIADIEPVES